MDVRYYSVLPNKLVEVISFPAGLKKLIAFYSGTFYLRILFNMIFCHNTIFTIGYTIYRIISCTRLLIFPFHIK